MTDDFPQADIVVTEAEVQQAYERLAAALQIVINAGDCVLLGVMLGGMVPAARLASLLRGDYVLDYCQVSRYRGGERGGELEWLQPPRAELRDRTVLIVDDICEEGLTLDYVTRACRELGCRAVVSTVLVRKRHNRFATALRPDHVGL